MVNIYNLLKIFLFYDIVWSDLNCYDDKTNLATFMFSHLVCRPDYCININFIRYTMTSGLL